MARTKQTARLCAQVIARRSAPLTTGVKGPKAKKRGKGGKGGKGRSRSVSS